MTFRKGVKKVASEKVSQSSCVRFANVKEGKLPMGNFAKNSNNVPLKVSSGAG